MAEEQRTTPRRPLRTRGQQPKGGGADVRDTSIEDALGPLPQTIRLTDGQEYTLAPWGFRALQLAQHRFGSLTVFQEKLSALLPQEGAETWELDLELLPFLIHLSTRRHHPELSEDRIADLLPFNPAELIGIVTAAVATSGLYGGAAEGGAADPPA